MKEFFAQRRPHGGLTFEMYVQLMRLEVAKRKGVETASSSGVNRDRLSLNLQRTERLKRLFQPKAETRVIVSRLQTPQLWMVLSEISCGDSAQNLPVIAAIAALNPLIDMRILLRDANEDIMELYLTGGTRSIPKLVAFTEKGREIFRWGPRPAPAREIFVAGKADGAPKEKIIEKIHLFYGRDRGHSVELEIAEILTRD